MVTLNLSYQLLYARENLLVKIPCQRNVLSICGILYLRHGCPEIVLIRQHPNEMSCDKSGQCFRTLWGNLSFDSTTIFPLIKQAPLCISHMLSILPELIQGPYSLTLLKIFYNLS